MRNFVFTLTHKIFFFAKLKKIFTENVYVGHVLCYKMFFARLKILVFKQTTS